MRNNYRPSPAAYHAATPPHPSVDALVDAQDPLIDLAAALVDAARAGDSRRLSRAALHTRAAIEHLHLAAESLAEVTS